MAFKTFTGQHDIVRRLNHAILNGTLSHSYVFSGPEGIGKRTLADAFVSELVCTAPDENGKCGLCNACRMYRAKMPVDNIWLQPESAHISIDDIRKIQNDVLIKPLYSDRKVYVISEGDKMTPQAQNCLLKILEEPPGYTVLIILAVAVDSLLPTVMSRVINYHLDKYSKEDLLKILKQNSIEIDPNYLNTIYGYSGGIPGKALELVRSEEFTLFRKDMIKLILSINNANMNIVDTVNYFDDNKENIQTLFNILQLFYRDVPVVARSDYQNVINADKIKEVEEIGRDLTLRKTVRNIQCINETLVNIQRNANFRLAVENMLITLTEV